MKFIRNELYDKYTKIVITYDTVFKELTKQDLMDIFEFHCANTRVLVEAVDYFYDLIQKDKISDLLEE